MDAVPEFFRFLGGFPVSLGRGPRRGPDPVQFVADLLLFFNVFSRAFQIGFRALPSVNGRFHAVKNPACCGNVFLQLPDLRLPVLQLPKVHFILFQFVQVRVFSFRRAVLFVQCAQLVLYCPAFFFQCRQLLLVCGNQAFQVFKQFGMFRMKQHLLSVRHLFLRKPVLQQCFQLPAVFASFLFQQILRAAQHFLIAFECAVVKQSAENFILLFAVRLQKFPEFSLGQHHDLAELLRVDVQQILDSFRGIFRSPDGGSVRFRQHGVHAALQLARIALLPEVDRSLNGILFPVLFKNKCHARVFRKLAPVAVKVAQVVGPVVAAGGSEQGKGNGVKDHGLAGAGLPGDQKEPVTEIGKMDFFLHVGAERLHFQINRFHCCAASCFRM